MSTSSSSTAAPKKPSFWQRFNEWRQHRRSTAPDDNQKALDAARHRLEILKGMPEGLDDFAKQRLAELIEQVDTLTDTVHGPEQKVQNGYITLVLIVVPIITACFLAYETGAFFYGGDFDIHSPLSWVQFGVAFILEAVLVAIVFEMAKAKRNGNNKGWRMLLLFWLFFVVTSFVGQFMYLLAVHGGNIQTLPLMGVVAIALRCAACCLVDLVCAGYLGAKPKTLEKQVDELSFKSKAIKTLTEAVIALEESLLASVARRKEEEQRQERRRVEDEQVAKLRNMIMEAGLNALTGVQDGNARSGW